jgi:hypothetical protein
MGISYERTYPIAEKKANSYFDNSAETSYDQLTLAHNRSLLFRGIGGRRPSQAGNWEA